MSVKIVRSTEEVIFNPEVPLETQAQDAEKIVINYNPEDSVVKNFFEQFERIVKTGLNFQANIQFNANHSLSGYRAERHFEKLAKDIEINEVAKMMVKMHETTEKHLNEMFELCERAANEQ